MTLLFALAACTFGPGSPYTRVGSASLQASFEPGARSLGEGLVVTDLGFRYSVSELTVSAESVALQRLEGADGVDFDPANPPDGYTLCHGGHCHAEDGSLVDYGDIIVELSGGAATLSDIAVWQLPSLDLIESTALSLGEPEPSLLPEGDLSRLSVQVSSARIRGQFQSEDGTANLPFDLEIDGNTIGADITLSVGRGAPPDIDLEIAWVVDGTLLDGIDAAALSVSPPPEGLSSALVDPVSDHLWTNPLAVEILESP